MAFSLVASVGEGSPDQNGFTTASINSSGANFLVAVLASYASTTAPTFSDSKSNTWTGLTLQTTGIVGRIRIFYSTNPTVGSSHTFTVTGATTLGTVSVMAWSGGNTSAPFDQENGATTAGADTLATGSVTPGEDNELIISGSTWYTSAAMSGTTVSASMTILHAIDLGAGASHVAMCSAYKVQTSLAAINPSWSIAPNPAVEAAAVVATFKATAAAGRTTKNTASWNLGTEIGMDWRAER